MQYAPQIEPVTKLVREHKHLLEQTAHGPVYLTQRGIEAAVLVSSKEWRLILQRLEQLEQIQRQERLARANQAYAAWQADPTQAINQVEYEQLLAVAGLME